MGVPTLTGHSAGAALLSVSSSCEQQLRTHVWFVWLVSGASLAVDGIPIKLYTLTPAKEVIKLYQVGGRA